MAKKDDTPDEETMAIIQWCIQVEEHLVAGGASQQQAQEYIEEDIETLTDWFFDGLTPEEAAQKALED